MTLSRRSSSTATTSGSTSCTRRGSSCGRLNDRLPRSAGQALGTIMGLPLAIARRSTNRLLVALAWLYSWFWRGTPLLVQLVIIYIGLADAGHLPLGGPRLRPAVPARRGTGGDRHARAGRGRLHGRDLPRGDRGDRPRPVGGGEGRRHGAVADDAARDPAAGAARSSSRRSATSSSPCSSRPRC